MSTPAPVRVNTIFIELLRHSLAVQHEGFSTWLKLSHADRLTVAFVLNRPSWLEQLNYSLADAIHAIGPVRSAMLHELQSKVEKMWEHTKPMEL